MHIFVTGAAGFIGSNLVAALLARSHRVTGYDNFSTGFRPFLKSAEGTAQFTLITGDILDIPKLRKSMAGAEAIFHLAANADVRFGTEKPDRDLQQNTIGTFNVLEAMRANRIDKICFSSTGSVYGECQLTPTPEHAPFPIQTSLYGASKLAGEGLVAAYAEGFGIKALVFRFVSILGPHYTHGHIFDFYKQLISRPDHLRVLGNGKQRKSYLHIQDCISAMLIAFDQIRPKFEVYNLGTDHYCEVNDSIGWICSELALKPTLEYTGGERGWIGDNPLIFLDCSKMRNQGWKPQFTIEQSVRDTLRWLRANPQVLDART